MKINTLAAIAVTGLSLGLLAGAPALAVTSLSKGKTLCEAATAEKFADAADINVDKDDTRSTEVMIWYTMLVKGQDGVTKKVRCTVDRDSGKATVFAS